VLGSLFAVFGALTYAEMATMFPRSGGVYVFLREAFGPLTGFLYGWATLLVVLAGGTAAVAVGFAEYFSYFFPALSSTHIIVDVRLDLRRCTSRAAVRGRSAIAVLGAINYVGVRSGAGPTRS
jgi:APA family basic amino acid/polyamine antiporter